MKVSSFFRKKRVTGAVVNADQHGIRTDGINADDLPWFDFLFADGAGEFLDGFLTDAARDLSDAVGLDADDDLRCPSDQIFRFNRTRRLLAVKKFPEIKRNCAEHNAAEQTDQRTSNRAVTERHADHAEPAERRQKHRNDAAVKNAEIVSGIEVSTAEIETDHLEQIADQKGNQQKQKTKSADCQKNCHQAE